METHRHKKEAKMIAKKETPATNQETGGKQVRRKQEDDNVARQKSQEISLFQGIDPKPIEQTTWAALIEQIRSDKHPQRLLIESIRKEPDRDKRNKLKKKLRAFTASGVFSYRKNSNVTTASGFIIADLDHIPDVTTLMKILKDDPYTWFCFVSPSGDGIKVGIRAKGIKNDADHKTLFAAVEHYFFEVYGIKIDPACKDICRLTFTSFDLGAFINSDAAFFNIEEWTPKAEPDPAPSYNKDDQSSGWRERYGHKVLENACNKIQQSAPGNQHGCRLRQGRLVGGFIASGFINESEAMTALENAVSASGAKDMKAAMRTVQDGIEYGKKSPLQPDEQHKATTDLPFENESKEDAAKRIDTRKDFESQINGTDDFEELTEKIYQKIKESNQTNAAKYNLFKKIARKAGVPVAMLTVAKKETDDSNGGNQIDIVEKIIEDQGRENIIFSMSFIWKWYQSGVWKQLDDREAKAWIQDNLKISEPDFDKNFINSILDLFKTETFIPNHRFNVNRDTINTLNGELSWSGETWELHAARRESYRTTQIPIEYDPAAVAPLFIKALNEMFRDDPDKAEKIIIILEMFGYCLLSSTEFEKFFMLAGPGANGKSVILSVLLAFLGVENVSAVMPGQLDNKFQRAHLLGKLANVVTEMSEGTMLPDAAMKSITSGESMTAENKFKPPFDFEPFSTLLFATNHLPHTRDFSEALFRRAIIIPFNRVFSEKEQDKNLLKKLKAELPGILNISLTALAGVFKRGHFTEAASVDDLKKQWRMEADQAAQYINECCHRDAGYREKSKDMYQNYRRWADDQGINLKLNRNNFTKRLIVLGADSVKGAGGVRYIAGFKIIDRIIL
jgi:putative DNA primase/helicase